VRAPSEAVPVFPAKQRQRSLRRERRAADIFSGSMSEITQQLISVLPGGRFLSQDGACAMVTGIPSAALNGVWFEHANPNVAAVTALLDEVSRAAVPYSLKVRSCCAGAFGTLAADLGMVWAAELMLMAVDAPGFGAVLPEQAGLAIRRLAPDEAARHASVAGPGFGIPCEVFLRAVSPDLLRLPSVRCYVGEVAGQPVTTSLGVTFGGYTGILNVATVPGFRGRGFAAAVTARAVADGLAAGSTWCWLEATAAAVAVYQRIGFRALEARQYWVSGPAS
jgi:ribosomal protein S18 acetylase RimI-like enzyme